MIKSPHLVALIALSLLLAACGGVTTPVPPTPTPTLTPTPRSTALPPAATEQALGSSNRPYQVVFVPPKDSTSTGTSVATFLQDRTGLAFKADVKASADALNDLCVSENPTFAWVDGLTLLTAQAQGCGTIAARYKVGQDGATGVRADLVVRTSDKITNASGLKDKTFCRLNSQDTVSWILPVIMMRANGFNPQGLKAIREFPDNNQMMQALADGVCSAAGIPAGSLPQFQVTDKGAPADITKVANLLTASSAELPYGGLVIAANVPKDIADKVTELFLKNPDQLKDLIPAGEVVAASANDFADIDKLMQAAGVNLKTLGQ